jgi:hypothetical protein
MMVPVQDRTRRHALVALLTVVVVASRLPFLDAALSSDEGGFLLVGSQWHGGSSLYGDYWVDRPPLLIELFGLAGNAIGLRLLGCLAAALVVVLADRVGSVLRTTWSPWPALAGAAFVAMPLFGVRQVDGELLAVPFVLGGLLVGLRASARGSWPGWVAAGLLGACAVLVKQNFVDVFVFGMVLLVGRRSRWGQLGALVAGGLGGLVAGCALAAIRGTSPADLWDALVVFRLRADGLIGTSADTATSERFGHVLLALLASGAVFVVLAFAWLAVRRLRDPLVLATIALLGWELFGVVAGGSYWLHYLIGLIPGLVLAVGVLEVEPGRFRAAARSLTSYAVIAAVVSTIAWQLDAPADSTSDRVSRWLAGQVRDGDTGVVLYGNPDLLWNAGLTSPYEELWSLPVRVRDPDLVELTAILRGPDAPTWVIAWDDMEAWGIDPATAREVVRQRYRLYAEMDGADIYRLGSS